LLLSLALAGYPRSNPQEIPVGATPFSPPAPPHVKFLHDWFFRSGGTGDFHLVT